MQEVVSRIKNPDFYHPVLLAGIGSAFINDIKTKEPELILTAPLIELGKFVIQTCLDQPYSMSAKTLKMIAMAKRWDTTKKIGEFWKTAPVEEYVNELQRRLYQLLDEEPTLDDKNKGFLAIIFKVMQITHSPEQYNDFCKNITDTDMLSAYHSAINKIEFLDQTFKINELSRRLDQLEYLDIKIPLLIIICTLRIMTVDQQALEQIHQDFTQCRADSDYQKLSELYLTLLIAKITAEIHADFKKTLDAALDDIEALNKILGVSFNQFCINPSQSFSLTVEQVQLEEAIIETKNALARAENMLQHLADLDNQMKKHGADQESLTKLKQVIIETEKRQQDLRAAYEELLEQQPLFSALQALKDSTQESAERKLAIKVGALKENIADVIRVLPATIKAENVLFTDISQSFAKHTTQFSDYCYIHKLGQNTPAINVNYHFIRRIQLLCETHVQQLVEMRSRIQALQEKNSQINQSFIAIRTELDSLQDDEDNIIPMLYYFLNAEEEKWTDVQPLLDCEAILDSITNLIALVTITLSQAKDLLAERKFLEGNNLTPSRPVPQSKRLLSTTNTGDLSKDDLEGTTVSSAKRRLTFQKY